MMKKIFCLLLFLAGMAGLQAQTPDGAYSGVLDVMGQMKLNITLRFGDGQCTMEIKEQGAQGLPMEVQVLTADSVALTSGTLGIDFRGSVEGDEIKGHFHQMGMALPLNLKKGEIEIVRPQDPQKPLLYQTEEVTFTNPADGAVLSGTLTYPLGWGLMKKDCPVVLMVTGSGLQDRNEETFNHRPFLVLADRLARMGIASLRYDDRGYGKSTGNAEQATTETFAQDAAAGLNYLRALNKFTKVGILGHSEGATIGFMLGQQQLPGFVVSLAGPAVRGIEISMEQNRQLLALAGSTETVTEEAIRAAAKEHPSAWVDFFFDYDPAPAIAATTCPVLAVNGQKDMQVDSKQNLQRIEQLLPANGKNRCKEYAGLNHLFQHCQTGAPMEYGQIEETMSEEVMKDIANYILGL